MEPIQCLLAWWFVYDKIQIFTLHHTRVHHTLWLHHQQSVWCYTAHSTSLLLGTTVLSARPINVLVVGISISTAAACLTLHLMLPLHPCLKTCTPAIPSLGLLSGHIMIFPISEFEIFVVSSPSRVGFPNWLWTFWGRHYAFSHSSFQHLAHFLGRHLTNICWIDYEVKVKVVQSFLALCDPMDYTVHGILQARILERVAAPFFRGSSQPWDQNRVSHIAGGLFTRWDTREVQEYWSG